MLYKLIRCHVVTNWYGLKLTVVKDVITYYFIRLSITALCDFLLLACGDMDSGFWVGLKARIGQFFLFIELQL